MPRKNTIITTGNFADRASLTVFYIRQTTFTLIGLLVTSIISHLTSPLNQHLTRQNYSGGDCELSFYVFIYSVCNELMVNPKTTDCLFDAKANSGLHPTRSHGAWGHASQTIGRLFSVNDSGPWILMNNAGWRFKTTPLAVALLAKLPP